MEIQQFIKTLNNTEIGKGGTHECYVLVSKKVKNISKLFEGDLRPTFINLKNGGTFDDVHITKGSEFRINGLGDFYRANKVNAGDEILFEKRKNGDEIKYYLNIKNKSNIIVFQKNSKGFDVLNIDRLVPKLINEKFETNVLYKGNVGKLEIKFKDSIKKRSDSPIKTDFYSLSINGKDILNNLKNNEYIELIESENINRLKKIVVWKTYEFNY
jgi:hypothetical protein